MTDNPTHPDHIDALLNSIVTKITQAPLTEEQKADALARISRGLHEITWPTLVSHIPEEKREEILKQTTPMTIDQYTDIMESVLQDKTTGKEVFDKIYRALSELNTLTDQFLQS